MQALFAWPLCASLSLGPATAVAEPAPDDLVAFDRGFREGQEQFNRGEYLPAARTWSGSVQHLHESPDNKENRAAVYTYIADAYGKSVLNGAGLEIVREGFGVLDAYADEFAAAYPGEPLPPQVGEMREQFRGTIAEAEAAAQRAAEEKRDAPPQDAPEDDAPPPKPWQGLTIGGGVALGVGLATLGMFIGGLVRSRQAVREYDDPAHHCPPTDPSGWCADIDQYGRSMGRVATFSAIAAPLLLGAGAAMLAIGLKRRAAARQFAVAPMFGPRMSGVMWELRF